MYVTDKCGDFAIACAKSWNINYISNVFAQVTERMDGTIYVARRRNFRDLRYQKAWPRPLIMVICESYLYEHSFRETWNLRVS